MKFNDKVYDILKWIVMIVLPAIGTLYFALASLWGLPHADQIVGTISAITTFLGVCLKANCAGYDGDGSLVIDTTDPQTDKYSLNLAIDLNELPKKKSVTLIVDTDQQAS